MFRILQKVMKGMNPMQYFLHQILYFKGADMNNPMYLYNNNPLPFIYVNFLDIQIGNISTQLAHVTSAPNQHSQDSISQASPTSSLSCIQTTHCHRLLARRVPPRRVASPLRRSRLLLFSFWQWPARPFPLLSALLHCRNRYIEG
jgi:hypothetical protein